MDEALEEKYRAQLVSLAAVIEEQDEEIARLSGALLRLKLAGEHHPRCTSVGSCTCSVRMKYSKAYAEAKELTDGLPRHPPT